MAEIEWERYSTRCTPGSSNPFGRRSERLYGIILPDLHLGELFIVQVRPSMSVEITARVFPLADLRSFLCDEVQLHDLDGQQSAHQTWAW